MTYYNCDSDRSLTCDENISPEIPEKVEIIYINLSVTGVEEIIFKINFYFLSVFVYHSFV